MGKKRQLVESVLAAAKSKNGRIVVFTGARQVGKTTLVRQVLTDYAYLSIEDPVSRPAYAALTAAQWRMMYPKAILDEIQKEPVLVESIKSAYDQFADVRYALLGSSQLLLMQKVKESLAGRCVIFDMYPLTLPEMATQGWDDEICSSLWQQLLLSPTQQPCFLPSFVLDPRMAQKKQVWDFYLRFGGYPALVDEEMSDEERYQWLSGYVRTYLERDIRDLASFRDLEPFVKLQHALALQTAQTFNASTLATHIGVSSKTAQRFLEYLNISYQTITLPAWQRNPSKRLTKAPKVHFMDNGVLQAVLQKRNGLTGSEFESLIVSELYKQTKSLLQPASFFHLRTQEGKEVDLLVELPDGYFAFEVKMTEHVSRVDARHLLALADMLDKPLLHAFILSNDVTTQQFSPTVTAVHAAMFLG